MFDQESNETDSTLNKNYRKVFNPNDSGPQGMRRQNSLGSQPPQAQYMPEKKNEP